MTPVAGTADGLINPQSSPFSLPRTTPCLHFYTPPLTQLLRVPPPSIYTVSLADSAPCFAVNASATSLQPFFTYLSLPSPFLATQCSHIESTPRSSPITGYSKGQQLEPSTPLPFSVPATTSAALLIVPFVYQLFLELIVFLAVPALKAHAPAPSTSQCSRRISCCTSRTPLWRLPQLWFWFGLSGASDFHWTILRAPDNPPNSRNRARAIWTAIFRPLVKTILQDYLTPCLASFFLDAKIFAPRSNTALATRLEALSQISFVLRPSLPPPTPQHDGPRHTPSLRLPTAVRRIRALYIPRLTWDTKHSSTLKPTISCRHVQSFCLQQSPDRR